MVQNTQEILERLVSFPSVSRDSNLEVIEYIEDYLKNLGIETQRIPSDCGRKANLFAQIGPSTTGGVVLSGHTDVVPVDGQDWHTDPWKLTKVGRNLHGRGTCDMKGFLAAVLSKVPAMKAARLKRPIQLAFSYDEEVGCAGAEPMVALMRDRFPTALDVIVGEPTLLDTVAGHKGMVGLETDVTGYEVHSSLIHKGVSAVMVAAHLVDWLGRQNESNSERPITSGAEGFDPPYTTLHTGTIHGGTAINITARDCRFFTDIRFIPQEQEGDWISRYKEKVSSVESRIKAVNASAGISVVQKFSVPAFSPCRMFVCHPAGRISHRKKRSACRILWNRGGNLPELRLLSRCLRPRQH